MPNTVQVSPYPAANAPVFSDISPSPRFEGNKGRGGGVVTFLLACVVGAGVIHANSNSDSSKPPPASSSAKGCSWTHATLDHRFQQAIKVVLPFEGGYNPHDPGGSMYGVSYDFNKGRLKCYSIHAGEIRKLTKAKAMHIYYESYWKASGADKIKDPGLQLFHFDTAVNMGIETAKRLYSPDLMTYKKNRRNAYIAIGGANLNGWLGRVDGIYKTARSWG